MNRDDEYITPGDVVAVRHGFKGRQEGLVIASYLDYAGRQVIKVQLDVDGELVDAWRHAVTRVRYTSGLNNRRTIERRVVYW